MNDHASSTIASVLIRDKSDDLEYRPINTTRKNCAQGHYYSKKGIIILDPVKVARRNNIPKFRSLEDLVKFLQKVNYNRWKGAEFDHDFIVHHIDIVRALYLTQRDLAEKIDRHDTLSRLLVKGLNDLLVTFFDRNEKVIKSYRDLHFELFGDE